MSRPRPKFPLISAIVLAACVAVLPVIGCQNKAPTSTTQPTQPAAVINPLTGRPLTVADVQNATTDAAAILALANAAGLSNQDTQKAQTILQGVSSSATTLLQNQQSGLPPDQQILEDVAALLGTYKQVKGAIVSHPAVVATVASAAKK